jgi:hypothetical protein
MSSDMGGWAWVFSRDDVIDRDHPDYSYWAETYELEEALASGEPHPDLSKPEEQPPAEAAEPEVPVYRMLAVTKEQAGALLGGKSVDWIEKHVLPYVRTVRPSRSVLIPASELERWLNENADLALGR